MRLLKNNKQKRLLAILLVSLFFIATYALVFSPPEVQGAELNIVDSFDSPGELALGLAWDGHYLWNAEGIDDKIYKLNASTGEVVDSIPAPEGSLSGLAWDGHYLWLAEIDDAKIYKLNPSTGEVIDSFRSPGPMPRGLEWDGHYLWNADSRNKKIYKLDPRKSAHGTGEVDSFSSPGRSPTGLAWDGHYLWNADASADKIYKLNASTGEVVDSFDIPVGEVPEGLAWDGHYLWLSDSYANKIYKIDVGAESAALVKITAISCPDEVSTDLSFTIDVTIQNKATIDVKNVTATIDLPNGVSLTSGSTKKSIGTIKAGEYKTVSWTAKASEPGDISIKVSISSANGGADSCITTLHVKRGVVYILTKTAYEGLPPFVWIVLMLAILYGSGIVVLVILKKREKAEIRQH